MRATLSKCLKVSVLGLLAMVPFMSFSQGKKDKVRIRIEQEINGKTKVDEKIIDTSGMSDGQKEDAIQKFQDSVLAENKGKVQGMKIEVEDESDNKKGEKRIERNYNYNNDNGDEEIVIRDKPRVKVYRRNGRDGGEFFDSEDFSRELNGNMESLKDNLKNIGKDLKFEYRTIPDGFFFNDNGGSSAKTVRGVEVFPNNPKTEILNVRFNAPQKGDVSIKVLDVKGSVVAKEEIKDFSGEYVGQINIGKQKGTIFVMITQGEDGTVKRVVLPTN
ncbi:T9SS type A sorting domain-containing protein [Emticicia sp. SJ17W-69]|uniref:T9SS type A sorting domain-containing protein n=1 Tax=Emticicia sp. SJ17W-69 TaxID=3421657 RepID=UPI003EBCAB35